MSDNNFASNRAAAAVESLRRGFNGVKGLKGPDLGMFTIDRLGAETEAQRAERKKAEREALPGWLHILGVVVAFVLIAGVFTALGTIVGNVNDADVRDIPWPTSVPSGERAEPEEGAR